MPKFGDFMRNLLLLRLLKKALLPRLRKYVDNAQIYVQMFDADVVEQFVRFVHTSGIIMSSKVSARELLIIADKYDVDGLKMLAQRQLIENFNVETICDTFEVATMIADAEALRAACLMFICNNREAVKWRDG